LVDFLQFRCHSQIRKSFSESQAAFGTTLRLAVGNLKAGTSLLKRVTGRIIRIIKDFMEASKNLILNFSAKRLLNNVKTIHAHKKSTDLILRTIKKIFIS
jgi:hypothetical protein